MKTLKFAIAFVLVPFFMSSYIVPEKDAVPIPYITFANETGEERTKPLTETLGADWKDQVKHAEFKKGETTVEVEGLVVCMPKGGEASVMSFKESKTFVTIIQKLAMEKTLKPGDRLIIDNIKIVGEKKNIYPIVHTLK